MRIGKGPNTVNVSEERLIKLYIISKIADIGKDVLLNPRLVTIFQGYQLEYL